MIDPDDFDPRSNADFAPLDGAPDCALAEARLALYVGADLDPADQRLVGEHLAHCASCTESVRRLREARQLYFEVASREPAVDLWPGVRSALVAEGVLDPADARRAPTSAPHVAPAPVVGADRRWVLVAPLSMAAAALLIAGLWRVGGGAGPSVGTPDVAVDTGAVEAESTASASGGLRAIENSERLLLNAEPATLAPNSIRRLQGGPESLASGYR
jgi:anti-sigma factor RsiW